MKETLLSKGRDYSTPDDKLHNFKRAAEVDRNMPEQALFGMANKHLVWILDRKDNPRSATYPEWKERLKDMRNYLVLLEALIYEDTPEYRAKHPVLQR